MRVKKLKIHNILGIEDLEFEPGNVTIVRGQNGTGKTSVLEAIKAVIGGGNDATLVRHGHDEGEVVLLLDDGTEVTKTVRREGKADLDVRPPGMPSIRAPQTWLNEISDAMAFNPVSFIHASSQDRVRQLLEAIPMEVDPDAIIEIADGRELPVVFESDNRHALEIIADVRDHFFDKRTGVNRVKLEKEKSAKSLRESLPEEGFDPAKIEQELEEADTALRKVLAARDAQKATADEARKRKLENIDEHLARQIEELREAAERDRAKVHDIHRERLESIDSDHDQALTELREKGATLQERLKTAERSQSAVKLLRETEADAERYAAESDALTGILERLDALRTGLEAEIPLEGVSIRDGEVYVEDVVWPRVNTARQVEVVVGLAELRPGKLPLVCVDGMECLDANTFSLMEERLQRSPLQSIGTVVDNDHATLQIEARGPVEVAS